MPGLRVNRSCSRLWRKHGFDLGVVGIAVVLGLALLVLLTAVSATSNQIARFGLPTVDAILLIFPEDQTVAMAVAGAVGLTVLIGGYSEVSKIRVFVGMGLVTVGLVLSMAGIVALLLPHLTLMSTLNGSSHTYALSGDSYWLDDSLWGMAAVGMVVSALLLKKRKVDLKDVATHARLVIGVGVALSVIAFSWSLLRLVASSEVILEIGLGGQKLPYITEQVIWFFPNGTIGRTS